MRRDDIINGHANSDSGIPKISEEFFLLRHFTNRDPQILDQNQKINYDYPKLLKNIKEMDSLYFRPAWAPRQWSLIDNSNREFLFTFCLPSDQKKLAGFIFGEINRGQGNFEIYKVIVLPEFRRLGMATELFEVLKSTLSGQSLECIILQVEQSNSPAVEAYSQWGFKKLRTIKNYYGNGHDALELYHSLV